ncbi:MAG TPA: hypothetical protein VKU80_10755 [Planctomycetota bacterium]|nr:hypothetical protein [Planctomycetota bacterium]
MSRVLGILAAALLALGLSACCMGSAAASGACCSMSSGGCKAAGKPMACDQKAACSCCAKEAAEGAGPQSHQH